MNNHERMTGALEQIARALNGPGTKPHWVHFSTLGLVDVSRIVQIIPTRETGKRWDSGAGPFHLVFDTEVYDAVGNVIAGLDRRHYLDNKADCARLCKALNLNGPLYAPEA